MPLGRFCTLTPEPTVHRRFGGKISIVAATSGHEEEASSEHRSRDASSYDNSSSAGFAGFGRRRRIRVSEYGRWSFWWCGNRPPILIQAHHTAIGNKAGSRNFYLWEYDITRRG